MSAKLGILIYENVQPMDVIGPWEVFAYWKKISSVPLDTYLIAEQGGYVECDNGIILKAHQDFKHCPQLDYFIVPGGQGRLKEVNNPELISFIIRQAQKCQYVISICTGMFLLYKAGILTHKKVTTYWRALSELKAFTDIEVIENRIVKDQHIWTSGGVSSGIDLALAFIAEVAGKEIAGQVQLLFEYFPANTVYCNQETVASLPPYGKNNNSHLPEYIQNYIRSV
ncbi:MAG TPA: DJ-1/PfpI family protein [Gammaproteobacteria bacterium]|nr:DJ-1/PfpI family protein [Gammaproteobacteria bacterium]